MGDSPKWVKSKKRRKRKKRRGLKDGDNNGQATHGARKHAWRTQAAWANKVQNMFICLLTCLMRKPDNPDHECNLNNI